MDDEKLPQSEFSPDRNPAWEPLTDKLAPPSATRRNLEDRYLAPDTSKQPRKPRVA